MYLTMVVYIGTPEAQRSAQFEYNLSSFSSPPVTTQGYPLELVVFRHVTALIILLNVITNPTMI